MEGFEHPMLAHNAVLDEPARVFLDALKSLTATHIVGLQAVQTAEYRGRFIVTSLFDALQSNPLRLMPPSAAVACQAAAFEQERMRVICDYVAGMTDSYAARTFGRLFTPGEGNVFERL